MIKIISILLLNSVILSAFPGGNDDNRNESTFIDTESSDIIQAIDEIEKDHPKEVLKDQINQPIKTIEQIYLSWAVLIFGLVLILFIGIIAYKKNSGWDRELTRIYTVSVIVTAGLFLITAGYTDAQIAPMYGLLGTLVGYLLGKPQQYDEYASNEKTKP